MNTIREICKAVAGCMLVALAVPNPVYAQDDDRTFNSLINAYLDCINAETQKESDEEDAYKLRDTNRVKKNCSHKRKALLAAAESKRAAAVVAQVEAHLAKREKTEAR